MLDLHRYSEDFARSLKQLKPPAVINSVYRFRCRCLRLPIFCHVFVHPSQCQHLTHYQEGDLLSGNPIDRTSSMSHIKRRFECSGYHIVCARQWHGHSPCVRLKLWRLRSPQASSRSSSSIIFLCVTSISSRAGVLFICFPIVFCLSKSLVFSTSRPKSSSPDLTQVISVFPGTVPRIFLNSLCEGCDTRAMRTHLGT